MSARPVTAALPTPRRASVVVEPRHRFGQWTLFAVFVIVAFFGLIASRVSLDGSAFELDELQDQISVEQQRNSVLQLEVARLQDPARVARAAERLGLVYPDTRSDLSVERVDLRLTDVESRWETLGGGVEAQP